MVLGHATVGIQKVDPDTLHHEAADGRVERSDKAGAPRQTISERLYERLLKRVRQLAEDAKFYLGSIEALGPGQRGELLDTRFQFVRE